MILLVAMRLGETPVPIPNTMASLKGNRLVKGRIKEPDYFLWREGLLCFNDTATTEIYTSLFVGSVMCIRDSQKTLYTGVLMELTSLRLLLPFG